MIPVGEPYRPAAGLDVKSAFAAWILAAAAATLAAALVWLWESSPVGTWLIITSLLQGLVLGGLMAFVIHRLKIHARGPALGLGLFAGALSVLLVHVAHYARFVYVVIPAEIAGAGMPPAQKQVLLSLHRAAPFRFADQFLKPETGHAGFVGHLLLRNRAGVTLDRMELKGAALWGLWALEGLVVVAASAALAASKGAQPFCDDCGAWCEKSTGLPAFPGELAEPLAEAIRRDDAAAIAEFRRRRLLVASGEVAGLTLYSCPRCDQGFLDLSRVVGSGQQTRATPLVRRLRVSPELLASLRSSAPSGPDPTPPGLADHAP